MIWDAFRMNETYSKANYLSQFNISQKCNCSISEDKVNFNNDLRIR